MNHCILSFLHFYNISAINDNIDTVRFEFVRPLLLPSAHAYTLGDAVAKSSCFMMAGLIGNAMKARQRRMCDATSCKQLTMGWSSVCFPIVCDRP